MSPSFKRVLGVLVLSGVLLFGPNAVRSLKTNFIKIAEPTVVQAAAVDYYLQIDSIKGESTDTNHKDWLELYSFSWGLNNPGTQSGGGGGAGKAILQDFHFTKMTAKSSPELMQAVASGKHFKQATLAVRKPGRKGDAQEYMVIKMTDVLISSYQVGGSGGIPTDSISFNFAKIEFMVDGNSRGWDFQNNQAPPVVAPID